MKHFLLALLLLAQQPPTPVIDSLLKELESLRPKPPVVSGTTVTVAAGANLQAAVDAAAPGSTLLLAQGATYPVNLRLRNKVGAGTITIRTAGLDDTVFPPGVRLDPVAKAADVAKLAKIACLDCLLPATWADAGAHDYTFIAVEWVGNVTHPDRGLIFFGYDPIANHWYGTYAEQPSNILFDRVYIHAPDATGGHQGMLMDGKNIAVINSDVRGFWEAGRDSQALGCLQAQGPLRIENNYLEGAGENFLCGGSDPTIPNAIPADILFTRNYVAKPLRWKDPAWQTAHPGAVKNLFELKNATRVTVTHNVFENVWTSGQAGNAIVFTPRDQDGTCPWCNVSHVLFACNEVRNSGGYAFNLLATDNVKPSGTMEDIVIRDNLVTTAFGGAAIGGAASIKGVTFSGNVFLGLNNSSFSLYGSPQLALSITGNFLGSSEYGIKGDGTGQGVAALSVFAPGAVVTGNAIETTPARTIAYPVGNAMVPPGSVTAAQWVCP